MSRGLPRPRVPGVRLGKRGRPARLRGGEPALRGRRGERGQAAVELVALRPLFGVVALAILQALAAGAAAELADHAAQSGAVAIAQGADGRAAARAAVPGWARDRVEIVVGGTRVRVSLTPPSLLPGLGERLRATASADAGPAS
ncbi:MAG TPA: hypothetical protein VLK58_25995 [Conexibacter sp.]|nr:hypothetical protein [Conexibacter sp.]